MANDVPTSRAVNDVGFTLTIASWVLVMTMAVIAVLMKNAPLGFWSATFKAMTVVAFGTCAMLSVERGSQRSYNVLMSAGGALLITIVALW